MTAGAAMKSKRLNIYSFIARIPNYKSYGEVLGTKQSDGISRLTSITPLEPAPTNLRFSLTQSRLN